jgi:probable rRNA maturation factor
MVPQTSPAARSGRGLPQGKPAAGARRSLTLCNLQRVQRLDTRFLRRILLAALRAAYPNGTFDLAFYIVSAPEITRLNETFLRHQGPTDVITFDYAAPAEPDRLHGEIFVCIEIALAQARQFRTTWQSELVRYAVHGALHLLGFDDRNALLRRKMKAAEDTLVRELAGAFDLRRLKLTRH